MNNKLDTIFTGEFKGENNHGAGSDLPKMRGLIFKPYEIGEDGTAEKGYTMMERMYTWKDVGVHPISELDVKKLKITITLKDKYNMSNPATSSADLLIYIAQKSGEIKSLLNTFPMLKLKSGRYI